MAPGKLPEVLKCIISCKDSQHSALISKLVFVVLVCITFWHFVLSEYYSECQCEPRSGKTKVSQSLARKGHVGVLFSSNWNFEC